jgi:hypothetical protein
LNDPSHLAGDDETSAGRLGRRWRWQYPRHGTSRCDIRDNQPLADPQDAIAVRKAVRLHDAVHRHAIPLRDAIERVTALDDVDTLLRCR